MIVPQADFRRIKALRSMESSRERAKSAKNRSDPNTPIVLPARPANQLETPLVGADHLGKNPFPKAEAVSEALLGSFWGSG
jgi:hypothetical protein